MLTKAEAQKKHYGDEDPWGIVIAQLRGSGPKPSAEKWVQMKFPYQTSDELPAPVPTVEEIEEARGTSDDLTASLSVTANHPVYRLHGVYAVKFSASPIILQEAENLLFLEQHSKVRVPKVFAVFSHQGGDPQGFIKVGRLTERSQIPTYHYLVMEYVSGEVYYSKDWKQLSLKAKENLSRKIGQQISLLREIPVPSTPYYGRINYQGFYPGYNLFKDCGQGLYGPYDSHKDFIHNVYVNCEANCIIQGGTDWQPNHKMFLESFERCMENASGQEPRLTHTDLSVSNIMVQPKKDDPEDFDIVIIDWATMAWMPAYYQAALAIARSPALDGRDLYTWELSQGIKPFPHDSALYFAEGTFAMCTHLE